MLIDILSISHVQTFFCDWLEACPVVAHPAGFVVSGARGLA